MTSYCKKIIGFPSIITENYSFYQNKHNELKRERIYNDKADSYPQHVGKFFNFRIFIEFFNHEVKKTLKFCVSRPYFYNKYQ